MKKLDFNDAECSRKIRRSADRIREGLGSGAALTSRLRTFETGMLAEEENFAGPARINRELLGKVEVMDSAQWVVLDMDSTEIPVYGE